MIREAKDQNFITAKELLEIKRLCCFLTTVATEISPDDIEICDKNCEKLGRIRYEAESKIFVFVPAIFEQEDC